MINEIIVEDNKGYTLMELLISLAILSLLTVAMVSTGFSNNERISEAAYQAECEKILYALLQYQNEAIMDGHRRQVRFLEGRMQVSWTKAGVNYKAYVPVENLTFTGSYTGATALNLYQHGTVSQGGTVNLISFNGKINRIIVQVGNGRIYLDDALSE